MPRAPFPRERLAALCHLTNAQIASHVGFTELYVATLLRRYELHCAPLAARARPARPSLVAATAWAAGQQEVSRLFLRSGRTATLLAQQLGVSLTMLRRELLGVRAMPPERVRTLRDLLDAPPP